MDRSVVNDYRECLEQAHSAKAEQVDDARGNPLADVVSRQYERWVYPEPILDLPAWLEHNWQWFDPSHAHCILWPDREYRADLDILVAGCGTNQAAVIAFTNPSARVVAIDVSTASLDHHAVLKERYSLDNLELHRLPIEQVASLQRDFDLIMSTGVLHHLADPVVGMQALARQLRLDGVMAVMLYAQYGRLGVAMLQSIFRDLGLTQDSASLDVVREALASLPESHPLASYLSIASDLSVDAGVVDTFLHGRDRNYTVNDCLDLVAASGLVFQDWFLKSSYYPPLGSRSAFHRRVRELPAPEQWSIMERINSSNACHFFLACHPERERAGYVIDFDSPQVLDEVPILRHRCTVSDQLIARYDWQLPLNAVDAALTRQIDGVRTLREVVDAAAREGALASLSVTERIDHAVRLFKSLWQLDFIAMGKPLP